MQIRSTQRDRPRLSGGPFRNTIAEFLRLSRPASHAQSDRDDARAKNCGTRRLRLSARRSFLDNRCGARRADATESCPAARAVRTLPILFFREPGKSYVRRGQMRRAFFIVGPTATGKSELAAHVAREVGAEIVSADAFQIYNGLDLLTAKPEAATLAKAPHHLVGTVPLTEEMN